MHNINKKEFFIWQIILNTSKRQVIKVTIHFYNNNHYLGDTEEFILTGQKKRIGGAVPAAANEIIVEAKFEDGSSKSWTIPFVGTKDVIISPITKNLRVYVRSNIRVNLTQSVVTKVDVTVVFKNSMFEKIKTTEYSLSKNKDLHPKLKSSKTFAPSAIPDETAYISVKSKVFDPTVEGNYRYPQVKNVPFTNSKTFTIGNTSISVQNIVI